jgi:quercetin dioxygenase-like cupin family protein
MTVFKYDDFPWHDPDVESGSPSTGKKVKTIVQGDCGFFVSSSFLPAGTRIEPHSHTADELMIILEGGCRLDDGKTLSASDFVVVPASQVYGFTVGDEGMRIAVVRPSKSALEWAR